MAQKRKPAKGLTFDTLMSIERIEHVAIAPDGRRAAVATARPDMKANEFRRTIHLLDLETGSLAEFTPGLGQHRQPVWSPDGSMLAVVSERDETGEQLWVIPAAGGEARRVTSGPGGVSMPVWAPDARRIAFARQVVVDPHTGARGKKGGKIGAPGAARSGAAPADPSTAAIYGLSHPESTAQIADRLLFRHWDHWVDRKRAHVFIAEVKSGRAVDITPFDRDAPPISLGSDADIAWSPDGQEIAYVTNPDDVVAVSTNNSVVVQAVRGSRSVGEPKVISNSEGCDTEPHYTPDGKSIVYLAMQVPAYEADRRRIKVFYRHTGETRTLLGRFDRSPDRLQLAGDGSTLVFSADDRGHHALYRLDLATGRVQQLTAGTYYGWFGCIPGSDDVLATRETTTTAAEVVRLKLGGPFTPDMRPGPASTATSGEAVLELTDFGRPLRRLGMRDAEQFWYAGAGEHPVHGFLVRPPGFRPSGRYPLILLVHGGPQSAFADHFHYRWNPQVFAALGAVVAFVNPRGSTGYGQKFTDQICGDWGGRCYEDIMRGVDFLLETFPFIDGERMAAAGASFGGFMVNWLEGNSDRFKALVCHDGIFNAETMGYTTEELWFDQYEHGGPPHERRRAYLKYSPHLHVDSFRTPMLVVHGGLDYRCPISEGIGMFTALQMKGIESRFLHFPDEGHWIMKPANAQVWYEELGRWMMRFIGR